MQNSIKITITALAFIASPQLFAAQNCPITIFDSNVSVFDSATPLDPPGGIYPVGGTGIGNGSFTVCDGVGVQIGARVSERFVGPITPAFGTGDYVSPIGAAVASPTEALWNFEGHIDLSHLYGVGVPPETFADMTYSVRIDCDPSIDGNDGPTLPLGLVPDNAILVQFSQNIGFSFLCENYGSGFDPNADGHYTLTAAVNNNTGVLAEVQINAIVGTPSNASRISAAGMIESQLEGFKFPDGTVQVTAAVPPTPPAPFPSTYIVTVKNDTPLGNGDLQFAACNAGDQIISGGGRCRAGLFADIMHKSCPANAAGACLDNGGTDFETWAVECDGSSRAFAYAVCLDTSP